MVRRDAVIRRRWKEWVENGRFQHQDGSGRLLSDESRSQMCPDDHRGRVCLASCQTLPLSARSLFSRACLGYDGKATTSNREC
ncbi:hypothetical protein TNCV_736431 [Trichonephila clavipes]|nr:hypothetical protein TNCV_736431 [Trichonephila clavipes]